MPVFMPSSSNVRAPASMNGVLARSLSKNSRRSLVRRRTVNDVVQIANEEVAHLAGPLMWFRMRPKFDQGRIWSKRSSRAKRISSLMWTS